MERERERERERKRERERDPRVDTYWILMEGGMCLGFLGYH